MTRCFRSRVELGFVPAMEKGCGGSGISAVGAVVVVAYGAKECDGGSSAVVSVRARLSCWIEFRWAFIVLRG